MAPNAFRTVAAPWPSIEINPEREVSSPGPLTHEDSTDKNRLDEDAGSAGSKVAEMSGHGACMDAVVLIGQNSSAAGAPVAA